MTNKIKEGQRFGKWTALNTIRKKTSSGKIITQWKVRCECGTISFVTSYDLNKGKTTQCRKCYGTYTKDLRGQKFGEWEVIREGSKKNGKTHWICKCSCGNEENVCAASLTKGVSTKCLKCYQKTMPIHGYTSREKREPLYDIWMGMIARCENPKHASYKHYGGKGITVCEAWKDFEIFKEEIGNRPTLKHSVDRIDNNKGYYKENCRWATHIEQGRNRSNNRIIEYNNEKKCATEWAEILNVKSYTLFKYLERNTFEEAYKHYMQKKSGLRKAQQ